MGHPMSYPISYIEKIAKTFKDPIPCGVKRPSYGVHRSIFSGFGLQFKDLRPYEYGDDSKNIHWNSFAKTQQLYVKTYEEERNVQITLILDCGNTMLWGDSPKSKLMACVDIIYLLYFICEQRHDLLEVHLWDESIIKVTPSKGLGGIRHFQDKLKFIKRMKNDGIINHAPKKYIKDPYKTRDFKQLFNPKNPLIVLSDFMELLPIGPLNNIVAHEKGLCLRIVSTLDEQRKRPFCFYQNSNMISRENKADSDKLWNSKDLLRWGIPSLYVKDNYLIKTLSILKGL